MDQLDLCLELGVEVQVCTIDPLIASTFNIHRVTGADGNARDRFEKMKRSLKTFVEKNNARSGKKMDIRTYKLFPTMILFIVDSNCFLSFMFHNTFARNAMHIQFDLAKEKYLSCNPGQEMVSAISYSQHFDDVFRDSAPATLETVEAMQFVEEV